VSVEIVTSCINCVTPGNLLATFVLIVIGAGLVVRSEMKAKA